MSPMRPSRSGVEAWFLSKGRRQVALVVYLGMLGAAAFAVRAVLRAGASLVPRPRSTVRTRAAEPHTLARLWSTRFAYGRLTTTSSKTTEALVLPKPALPDANDESVTLSNKSPST